MYYYFLSEFETVVTPQGSVDVYKGGVQGRNAPFLITFHDLGLNHSANYSVSIKKHLFLEDIHVSISGLFNYNLYNMLEKYS